MAPTENLHTPRLEGGKCISFEFQRQEKYENAATTTATGGREVLGNGLRHLLSELMFFSKVFTLFILTFFVGFTLRINFEKYVCV